MTIVFLDTETLGLDPVNHEIWEVGAIRYDEVNNRVQNKMLVQLKLTGPQLLKGDPIGMEIGKFSERRLPEDECLSIRDFIEEFKEFCPKGSHLAGAVVSFDEERLRRMFRKKREGIPWHYHLIDVEVLGIGFLRAKGIKLPLPYKSDIISDYLDIAINQEDKHTALGDAQWALDMYRAVML